ncbi:Ig-like domain-containing protein [Mangrovibacterium diazotrophicum]|uniref:Putative secreted protein (Por secretion system target) n=1 Tax=Mangrovibacterium diazotrophicum TaxID=1261403 RepID=A0A419W7Y7_9BACT|nr:Ig-like domain-containing protein [Mangrovibacterium diazotrophicum]RKD91540.1 putative secreted protein (Por secretion system target) [Mangrovibacterium diazotrophicum]
MKRDLAFAGLLCLLFLFSTQNIYAKQKELDWAELSTCTDNTTIPFKAKGDYFSVWDGKDYTKLFLKGINLGISVPGTLPGELAASSEQYAKWFDQMKQIGYNNIRLYTLHYPRFYEELRKYNLAHPQSPLLLFQGIWLEEPETDLDLYNKTTSFETEIEEVINCVHGNATLDTRFGKAYGTFTADVSQWVIGYIIGREVFPGEITVTNDAHSDNAFTGNFLSISEATASETWICSRMDKTITYEYQQYATQRPVCFSSWPTLDPLTHPTEANRYEGLEDRESIDLSKVDGSNAQAGFFVSYHAYPYYPDFMSDQPEYTTYYDSYGPNSYLGYLYDLKSHYENIPLVVAEFGVPTSWGIAHLAQSNMHHGGISEEKQGIYTIRMLENIEEAGLAGGMQFSWIDEWFKQAWITNPLSDENRRYVWHNITNPEQNFGVISFDAPQSKKTTIGSYSSASAIQKVKASADPTYFHVDILSNTKKDIKDGEYWIAFDTYSADAGESILPDGESITKDGQTLRAEFALQVDLNDTVANLYVTKAYDTYGIKLLDRLDTIVSTVTDGEDWNPVRWKVNYSRNDIQYIGRIKITPSSSPYGSLDPIYWNSDSISIALPWTLLNFRDPSHKKVTYYTSNNDGGTINVLTRDSTSTGIAMTVVHQSEVFQTDRYAWEDWEPRDLIDNPPLERLKQSALYIEDHLSEFNSAPVANCDNYEVNVGEYIEVSAANGLLANDMDFDSEDIEVVIPDGYSTMQGNLYVHPNGSFEYEPFETASGTDQFMYYATDGDQYSRLVTVTITLNTSGTSASSPVAEAATIVYPNPTTGQFKINISEGTKISDLQISSSTGFMIKQIEEISNDQTIDMSNQLPGIYNISFIVNNQRVTEKLIKY